MWFGSLTVGWLGGRRRIEKLLLFAVYFTRAVAVLGFLAAPKTALTFYVFSAVLGLTWLATFCIAIIALLQMCKSEFLKTASR